MRKLRVIKIDKNKYLLRNKIRYLGVYSVDYTKNSSKYDGTCESVCQFYNYCMNLKLPCISIKLGYIENKTPSIDDRSYLKSLNMPYSLILNSYIKTRNEVYTVL